MTTEASTDHWESRYQAGKTGWDRGAPSPALQRWLSEGTLAPCRILVPGAGRGHEVVALAGAGFEVTAVDVSPTPVQVLRERLAGEELSAAVVQADLLDWQPDEPFDAVYDQTCLCALEPRHWDDYTDRLHGWLRPGGRLFALFMQTHREGGPPYHCDLATMEALFHGERWQWPAESPQPVSHPSGLEELATILVRR